MQTRTNPCNCSIIKFEKCRLLVILHVFVVTLKQTDEWCDSGPVFRRGKCKTN